MPLIKGAVTFTAFKLIDTKKMSPSDLVKNISKPYRPPTPIEESAYGFVAATSISDQVSNDPIAETNPYVFCDFRYDAKRISSKLIKAEMQREVREERNGKPFPKVEVADAKERAKTKLLAITSPTVNAYPVLISLKDNVAFLGCTSSKIVSLFMDSLIDEVDIRAIPLTPFTITQLWAESLGKGASESLAELRSTSIVDGEKAYAGLGGEFLAWFTKKAQTQEVVNLGEKSTWKVSCVGRVEALMKSAVKITVSGFDVGCNSTVKQAVKDDASIRKLKIAVVDNNEETWIFGISGKNFTVTGLKIPGDSIKKDGADTRFIRAERIGEFWTNFNNVFTQFSKERWE